MKKLLVFALSAIATAAIAAGPAGGGIEISGSSDQAVILFGTAVTNTADGANAKAQQNLSTNAGNVEITNSSQQTFDAFLSNVTNLANGNTIAQQNGSSNVGDATISGNSIQLSFITDSTIANSATGYNASAVQSTASNTSCFTCK